MQDALTLPHSRFYFQVTPGTVASTNQWTETRVDGGGRNNKSIQTQVSNHLEFWLKLENGKERAYHVDANKVSLREGNEIEVLELVYNKGKKAGQYEVVMVSNNAQDMLYPCKSALSLAYSERPTLMTFLILFMGLGFAFWWSDFMAFMHLLTIVVGGPYILWKRRQYKKILKRIAKDLFNVSRY